MKPTIPAKQQTTNKQAKKQTTRRKTNRQTKKQKTIIRIKTNKTNNNNDIKKPRHQLWCQNF